MGAKQQTRKHEAVSRVATLVARGDLPARGAGAARRVHDPQLGRDVVLVTIDAAAVGSSKARRYVKRHLEAARGLDHPAIVPLLDGGTDDGEGRGWLLDDQREDERPLRARLAEGPLPARDALAVGLDVLNALAYAHARGLVHGGLSPDGVLVRPTPDGLRGRLVDYGFARVVGAEQEGPLGPVRVDTDYAAPEMIKSEFADGRADVYSAALLLQEMLAGQHPIPAPPKGRVLHRLNESAPPLPAGLIHDAPLEAAVRAALRTALLKNPAARFPSARAFAEALRPGAAPTTEVHPVVAPGGGVCAATKAAIAPAGERPAWSRHQSDGPFVCPVTGELFAGKDAWDARALCCKKGVDRPLTLGPAPSGRADVALELGALAARSSGRLEAARPAPVPPAPAPSAPVPPAPAGAAERARAADLGARDDDRREALKALLGQERLGAGPASTPARTARPEPERAAPAAPSPAPAAPSPAPAAPAAHAPKDDAAAAILDAWSSERERARQAAERSHTSRVARPPLEVPSEAPPERRAPAPAADGAGWRVVAAALVLVLGYVVVLWRQDKARWQELRDDAERAALAEKQGTNSAYEALAERGAEKDRRIAGLQAELARVTSSEAGVRAEKATLDARLAEARAAQLALDEAKRGLEGRLAEATGRAEAEGKAKAALEGALQEKASALAALADERAGLARRLGLEPSTADRAALERRLGEVEAARERLATEHGALAARVEEAGRALAATQQERAAAGEALRRALARVEDAELERRDLELQLVTATRGAAELTTEKRALEASLAEAQEALRAQEQLVAALLAGDDPGGADGGRAPLAVVAEAQEPGADEVAFAAPGERLRALLVDAAAGRVLLAVRLAPAGAATRGALELPDGQRVPLPLALAEDGAARAFLDADVAARALEALEAPEDALTVVFSPRGDPARAEAELVATPLPPEAALRLRASRP